MTELGTFLYTLRTRAQLSQVAVSQSAELSVTYYGKIESEERRPSTRALWRILDVLGASPDERRLAIGLFARQVWPETFLEYLKGAERTTSPVPFAPTASAVPSPVPTAQPYSPSAIARRRYRRRWIQRVRLLGLVATIGGATYLSQPPAEGSVRLITNRDEVLRRIRRPAA